MKKLVLGLLVALLIGIIVIGGCTAPAAPAKPAPAAVPAPAQVPSAAPVPAPSAAGAPAPAQKSATPITAKTWTIRLSTQVGTQGWLVQKGANVLAEKVQKATNGRVKIEVYGASTLCKAVDEWQAVKSGIAGTAFAVHGSWPGMTPYADVMALPFMPFKSGVHASQVYWQLLEKIPSFAQQFTKDNKIWFVWTSDPYFLITTKKQVKVLEDFKNMKIRALGGPPTEQMKALGAVPMNMPMIDTYLNLQKGVSDGMGICWEALTSFRQYEVVKYYLFGAPLNVAYFSAPLSWEMWNDWPKDLQEQMMSIGGLEGSKMLGGVMDSARAYISEEIKKGKYPYEEYTVPEAELQKWVDVAGKPLWESWVKGLEAQGYKDARLVLNTALELAKTIQ